MLSAFQHVFSLRYKKTNNCPNTWQNQNNTKTLNIFSKEKKINPLGFLKQFYLGSIHPIDIIKSALWFHFVDFLFNKVYYWMRWNVLELFKLQKIYFILYFKYTERMVLKYLKHPKAERIFVLQWTDWKKKVFIFKLPLP